MERKNPIKCPKCGNKKRFNFIEMWAGRSVIVEYEAGLYQKAWEAGTGDPTHVIAVCSCKHRWKLRGVNQLWDLPGFQK